MEIAAFSLINKPFCLRTQWQCDLWAVDGCLCGHTLVPHTQRNPNLRPPSLSNPFLAVVLPASPALLSCCTRDQRRGPQRTWNPGMNGAPIMYLSLPSNSLLLSTPTAGAFSAPHLKENSAVFHGPPNKNAQGSLEVLRE